MGLKGKERDGLSRRGKKGTRRLVLIRWAKNSHRSISEKKKSLSPNEAREGGKQKWKKEGKQGVGARQQRPDKKPTGDTSP